MPRILPTMIKRFLLLVLLMGLGATACGSGDHRDAQAAEVLGRTEAVPATYFGQHIHRLTRGSKWPEIGLDTWRIWDSYTGWRLVEPQQDQWNFRTLDQSVAIAEEHGAEMVMTFGVTPGWAALRPDEHAGYGPGSASEPRSLEDYRDYVRTTALRYKGRIRNYEVWNEPNLADFFTGSPEVMAAMTKIACAELKSVDPSNRVLGPSPMSGSKMAVDWYRRYLKALGPQVCFDVVAWHFYTPRSIPEEVVSDHARVRALLVEAGLGALPLWNTESGYYIENQEGPAVLTLTDTRGKPVLSQEQAAAYVARALLTAWASGIDRYYWYAWDDNKVGLINVPSGTLKPAGQAFGTIRRWMIGSSITACQARDALWSCEFKRNGKVAHAVWTERDSRSWAPPAEWKVTAAQDLQGRLVGVAPGPITVTESPLLLTAEPELW